MHPTLVPAKRLIANVEGAMNAVVVQGDAVGTTLYYGKGAGSEPTASAVIADLVDITRLHTADAAHRVPHLAFQPDAMSDQPILPMSEVVTSYYLRLRVADQAGVLAKVTGLLADAGISIDAMLQREADEVGGEGSTQTDLIILTHGVREGTMNDVHRADAGAADRAGADRAHPQGRTGLSLTMLYLSTRGHPDRKRFCDILLEGLAPDGGLYLPERYPQVDAATLAKWRGAAVRRARLRDPLALHRRHPGRDLKAICAQDLHRRRCSAPRRSCRCATLEDGVYLEALSNGPTLAFKDMAMQLLGNLFEYELARRGEELNILGATSGDTGSAAEYAMRGKKGVRVFMTSPDGRMSPFQQAQMFSLQDANIHNLAIEGVFDDCQDIVKAVSNDLAFKRKYRIGTVNSINWARLLAQVVYYFAGYFQATARNDEQVSFTVPSGNFGNICAGHVARMMGLPIAAAGGGHQRERRARRVLPHRRLPRARQRRHARDLQPVDGHLQGQQLRALRVRPAGPRRRQAARRCSASELGRKGRFDLSARPGLRAGRASASASSAAAARMPTAWPPSATPTSASAR